MPRPLHLVNRILRAVLIVVSAGSIAYYVLGNGEDWVPVVSVVTVLVAIGLSPALWPALPAPAEKPAPPVSAPPQPAYQAPAQHQPQQQQQYQPPQQQTYPQQQATTYGGHAQVPQQQQQQQQQQQWPGQHHQ
ncbi:hypothetical protein [Phytomonospora endophytica]|uniref:Uncharacterized protein n=1 Tax=Phytomonospora endophytica TaxID=714109 RepID=A0A841FPH6_9ACTN|nr:hypothetical protein [Phytomonospora endophytica]MBB6035698.1 hypothetical protein [Phytomonospora endophytica]GIG69625.1 hypothetical protein Pen01_59200 [Phytomonospora endophytica]